MKLKNPLRPFLQKRRHFKTIEEKFIMGFMNDGLTEKEAVKYARKDAKQRIKMTSEQIWRLSKK